MRKNISIGYGIFFLKESLSIYMKIGLILILISLFLVRNTSEEMMKHEATVYHMEQNMDKHFKKIEDIINGVASGNSNFISVSPVSYRGQKYYWDRDNVIIAYDYVPNGNFICSSISNMGTNYKISNNSSEVGNINRIQRGILETSAVTEHNSEALLYREGLIPCGLILPGGRTPTASELEFHRKYNVPFIITQEAYQAIDDVESAMKGMLAPKYEEHIIGNAEVRQTFKVSNVGTIAGAYILTGKVSRNAGIRIIRDNIVIHDAARAPEARIEGEENISQAEVVEAFYEIMEEAANAEKPIKAQLREDASYAIYLKMLEKGQLEQIGEERIYNFKTGDEVEYTDEEKEELYAKLKDNEQRQKMAEKEDTTMHEIECNVTQKGKAMIKRMKDRYERD